MKRFDVGRVRVACEDGTVAIDHSSAHGQPIVLEAGELDDLLVALDAIQEHVLTAPEDIPWIVHTAFTRALHEVFKHTLLRCKLELHVNYDDFYRLVGKRTFKSSRIDRPDRLECDFGSVKLVTQRGRHI